LQRLQARKDKFNNTFDYHADMAGAPEHILVFVPGYMGSTLRDTRDNRTVWLDFSTLPVAPWQWGDWLDDFFARMAYPKPGEASSSLKASGIVDDVIVVTPFIKQEQYGRLFIALEQMGYIVKGNEASINVYKFAYDWRQDNRISAKQLGDAIAGWRSFHPNAQVWILAHSNGGVVARWYVEKEGGKNFVSRLFLMGSPFDGTPKVMRIAFNGADMLSRPGFDPGGIAARTRTMFRSFPSLYQLIPVLNRFLVNTDNEQINAFDGMGWLDDEQQRAYLLDGQKFTQDLGDAASVETICFFGRKRPTLTSGRVRFEAVGKWTNIEWAETESGDGTIPERSAAHPNATMRLPFVVGHGDIYVHPAVLEMLRWELIDKFDNGIGKALVETESMWLSFNPEKDGYRENETIWLRATLTDKQDQPLPDASITVTIQWDRPLPGDVVPADLPAPLQVKLVSVANRADAYEGLLFGPAVNGYYRLTAEANHPELGRAVAEELIAVETERLRETVK
jgi:pimeloyl-ACP methyl ester carboxylesterase